MIRLITICLLSFTLFIPMVGAEEKPVNIISCRSGTVSMLSADKELVVYAYELKGIDQDLKEDKIFENYTHRCMGVTRVVGGEQLTRGYCKYMGPDGDYFIVSYDGPMGKQPLPWEYIYGTGKWKGIKGGGTVKPITRGKPIAEGTFQMCVEVKGTYEVPQ